MATDEKEISETRAIAFDSLMALNTCFSLLELQGYTPIDVQARKLNIRYTVNFRGGKGGSE